MGEYYEEANLKWELDEKMEFLVLAHQFYVIAARSRDDGILSMFLNKKFVGGKSIMVSGFIDHLHNSITNPEVLPFLEMMHSLEPKPLALAQTTQWCYWSERQIRVSTEWIGRGKLIISLDGNIFTLCVLNRDIESIEHRVASSVALSKNAQNYFLNCLEEFNLNMFKLITPQEGVLYFSIDNENNLGFFSGNNAKLGVQSTKYDTQFDISYYNNTFKHNFMQGYHYIELQHINRKLYTYDTFVIKRKSKDLFDCIDWDSTSDESKNNFMRILLSGDYGEIDSMEYDKQDLISNFLCSDLYKLFYKARGRDSDIRQTVWEDILTQINYSEDIFPTLYENLGLDEIESVLPRGKKDNLALYLYYETDNNDLRILRQRLARTTDEDEKVMILTNVILSIKDKSGIAKLPEIGDPEEFSKFKKDNLDNYSWMSVLTILISALYNGYKMLDDKKKIDIAKLTGRAFTRFDKFENFFLMDIWRKSDRYLHDYAALTIEQGVMHRILEYIHGGKYAFAEFARTFRSSILSNVPRHPYYESNWHTLIANMYRFFYCQVYQKTEPKQFFPASILRHANFDRLDLTENMELAIETGSHAPIVPPVLKILVSVKIEDDFSPRLMDLIQNSLATLCTDKKAVEMGRLGFIDYMDDEEIEVSYKAKKPSKKIKICRTIDTLVGYTNSKASNNNFATATKIIIPYMRCEVLDINSPNGKERFFVYNYSTRGEGSNPMPKKYQQLHKDYIDYYGINEFVIPAVTASLKKEIKLDLNNEYKIDNLSQTLQVTNQDSYTDDLAIRLKKEFDIPAENTEVEQIVKSNKTPVAKFTAIRTTIKKIIKENSHGDGNVALDKIIADFCNNNDIGKSVFDRGEKIKNNLNVSFRNPNPVLLKTSQFKTEYKQANTLLNDRFGSILTDDIILSQAQKTHLLGSFKLLRSNFKAHNQLNESAVCSTLMDVLSTVKEGRPDTQSTCFEEEVKQMMNELMERLSSLSPCDEDELTPPSYSNVHWKFRNRRRQHI